MPPIWRHHYQYWTAADLLISNLLRAEPLGYEVLTQYGDHSLNSIRTTMNLLRRQGRVSRHGEVIPEHPKNIRMTTGVPFGPLPDPGGRPPPPPPHRGGPAPPPPPPATELTAAVPPWLQADHDALTAKVLRLPERSEITAPIQEQLIVEFYSK